MDSGKIYSGSLSEPIYRNISDKSQKVNTDSSSQPAAKSSAPEAQNSEPLDTSYIDSDGGSEAIKPHKKWLIINYIAADCNVRRFQLANIDQLESVGSDDNTHLAVFIDAGPTVNNYTLNGKPWTGAKTIYIQKDQENNAINSEVIQDHGDRVDMSNYQTLKDCVVSMIKKFPSENVALILNDHGAGFTGAMTDDHQNRNALMSIPDMKKALLEAQEITGKKIDILGFDACLMGEAEVAYELKDTANIFLASEELEKGNGWDYRSMIGGQTMAEAIITASQNLSKNMNISPYEFAKIIVDVNRQHPKDIPTFSATNLKFIGELKEPMKALSNAIINYPDKKILKKAISESEHFGGDLGTYKDLRDLGHLAKKLEQNSKDEDIANAAKAVGKVLSMVVFDNTTDTSTYPESQGLSIYAPIKGQTGDGYNLLQFVEETHWDEALESLGVFVNRNSLLGILPEDLKLMLESFSEDEEEPKKQSQND